MVVVCKVVVVAGTAVVEVVVGTTVVCSVVMGTVLVQTGVVLG